MQPRNCTGVRPAPPVALTTEQDMEAALAAAGAGPSSEGKPAGDADGVELRNQDRLAVVSTRSAQTHVQ